MNNDISKAEQTQFELDEKINKIIDDSNEYRVNTIKEFINQLNSDFVKYRNKKNKYCKIKNILMGIDLIGGSSLTIASIILEVVSLGVLSPVSISLSALGFFMVTTIPFTNKISDKLASKNRNFEVLSIKKLNEVKIIFSKAIEDNNISHEEYLLVMEVKDNYEKSKIKLKTQNKKEIEKIFEENKSVINKGFSLKDEN